MRATVDSKGRVLIPRTLRDALGMRPGSEVDLSQSGGGLHIEPGSRGARLEPEGDRLVIASDTVIDDHIVLALIDVGRR